MKDDKVLDEFVDEVLELDLVPVRGDGDEGGTRGGEERRGTRGGGGRGEGGRETKKTKLFLPIPQFPTVIHRGGRPPAIQAWRV